MKIITVLGQIIWAIVCIFLYFSATVYPISCLIFIISIFFNFLDGLGYVGIPIETLGEGEKVYIFFITLFMSTVSILYVSKYREKVPGRNDLKYAFVSALLLYFVLVQGHLIYHYNKQLGRIRLSNVSIKCFDYHSKEPVPISLSKQHVNPLPKITTMAVPSKLNELRLDIVSNKEVKVKVSSKGYEKKEIIVGRESKEMIEVYLKKLSNND